ncbi:MAG: hypothetical protein ABSH32_32350 [Bryobacteraceae bacterium]
MRTIAIFAALLVLLPVLCPAQGGYSRRRPSTATATAGPYTGPAVTFHGTLKALTKKELIMDLDAADRTHDQAEQTEDQSITFRVSRKTKFLKNDQEIKPADIPVGTHLTLDATRDGDLKLSALNVMVAVPPAKPEK